MDSLTPREIQLRQLNTCRVCHGLRICTWCKDLLKHAQAPRKRRARRVTKKAVCVRVPANRSV